MPCTVIQAIRERARTFEHAVALTEGSLTLTNGGLWQSVKRTAARLAQAGVEAGDLVILHAPNQMRLGVALLAVLEMRAVAFPLAYGEGPATALLTGGEVRPKAIIAGPERHLPPAGDLSGTFGSSSALDHLGLTLRVHVGEGPHRPERFDDSTALLVTSSGTTGPPKVVRLSRAGISQNIAANIDSLGLRPDDRSLMLLPLAYSYGLIGQFLSHLTAGAAMVFPRRANLLYALDLIRSGTVTTVFTVPAMLRMLLAALSVRGDSGHSRPAPRLITVGGGAIDVHSLSQAMRLFPDSRWAVTYGLAEAGPRVSTYFVDEEPYRAGLVGSPIGGVEVRVLGAEGAALGPGAPGRIAVHSPSVMLGYYRGNTDLPFVPEAFVQTPDMAYTTTQGLICILGRASESADIAGRVVYHNQIKEVLYAMGDILHAHLDPAASPLLRIGIIPLPGKQPQLAQIKRHCAEALSLPGELIHPVIESGQARLGALK